MLSLHIEVRAESGPGPVQYRTWELPLQMRRKRQGHAEAQASELETPLGLMLAVTARWWPGVGGDLSVAVAGDPHPLADLSPLADGMWLTLQLPTGERLTIRARG